MKTVSDELFQFIKSLDPHEKSFLKNSFWGNGFSSQNKKLFNYLLASKQYDEKILLQKLNLTPRVIKNAKYSLYQYLLKKLELYYSETSEEQKLYKIFFQIQLLRQKNFFKKANTLLVAAIERAKKYNFYLLHAQLLAEQEDVLIKGGDVNVYDQLKSRNNTEVKTALKNYEYENFLKTIHYEFLKLKSKQYSNDTKLQSQQKLKKIYRTAVAEQQKKEYTSLPITLQLQLKYLEYHSLYFLMDYSTAQKAFTHYLRHCLMQDTNLYATKHLLIQHLVNGTAICNYTYDEKLILQLDKKADAIFLSIPLKLRASIIISNYFKIKTNVIYFMAQAKKYEIAKTLSEKLWGSTIQKHLTLEAEKVFLANWCQIYICCNEPKKALSINNILRNNRALRAIRIDIDYLHYLIELIIYYDLKLWNNLESMIRHCIRERAFEQRSTIYKTIVYFFSELLKEKKLSETLIKKMINYIDSYSKKNKRDFEYSDVMIVRYWLQNKIGNKIQERKANHINTSK